MTDTQRTLATGTIPQQRDTASQTPRAPRPRRTRLGLAVAAAALAGVGLGWGGAVLVGGTAATPDVEPPGITEVEAARWQAQVDYFEQLWGHRLYERAQQGDQAMGECLASVREP